jgi:hypothetical protein
MRAVAAVAQGRLTANKEGVVDLPANMQSISVTQKAYVKREADGTIWVFLPETVDANLKGQLYCSKPPAQTPSKVRIIGPNAGGVGPVEMTIDGGTPDGWYTVHSGG